MMISIRTPIALFLAIVMVALVACSPAVAPSPAQPSASTPAAAPAAKPVPSTSEWDKVLAAAAKEGSVTVYNALGVPLGEALKAGMAKQGIKVDAVGGAPMDLLRRMTTEQQTKAVMGDLYLSGLTTNLTLVKEGYGQVPGAALPSLQEKDIWKRNLTEYDATKTIYVYGWSLTPSIIVNTDMVAPGEIKSFQDLLDAKWRDRMAMTDPRTGAGPGTSGLGVFMGLGEDFWKKMAAQRISLSPAYDLPVTQVALGEKSVTLFPAYSRTVMAIRAGAPIQIVHIKEGTSYYVNAVNMMANAPHPNAALVTLNWMFSKEGQAAIGRATDNYAVRKDVAEDWLRIRELTLGTFSLLEPANNSDPGLSAKSTAFAKKVFATQ